MYRILSPTAILGYGFPSESFNKALEGAIDLIAVDAGSMDAGPFYLGARVPYVGDSSLKRDLELMVKGALEKKCPLIIGSAGFSGGDTQLYKTVELVKAIVQDLGSDSLRLAVIPSGVSSAAILSSDIELSPLGEMSALTDKVISESEIVGQMGIEPIVTALENGARIVVCGRAYDPAIFAADAIRKGYPAGICFHAAKILECGAIACEPGSGSDCLIAELTKEGVATFYPANEKRVATVRSIAAHTLYEKAHPNIFRLPGGALSIGKTRFSQINERTVSMSGSAFFKEPYSIKLEGARSLGQRLVSVLPLQTLEGVDEDIRVYGRNGVETGVARSPIEEMGMVVVARGDEERIVRDALAFVRSTLLHFGYEGRLSTAGNLAFPFSPSDFHFEQEDGQSVSLFVAGSRDPVFQSEFEAITHSVLAALEEQHNDLFQNATIEFIVGDSSRPIALLETIAPTLSMAKSRHAGKAQILRGLSDEDRESFSGIDAGIAYSWSIHHLVKNRKFIEALFPIQILDFAAGEWKKGPVLAADYGELGEKDGAMSVSENSIEITQSEGGENRTAIPLQEIAKVIRSKNAGINEITFDILFDSETEYHAALDSGQFHAEAIAATMGVEPSDVLGCYRFDPAYAIKFTLRRRLLCGSPGERDVFGAQQHSKLLNLQI